MKFPLKMQKEPFVRRCALPITLRSEELGNGKGSRKAVLGLHGFAGYPGELSLPASVLFKAGYSVFIPRLPGHGTNGEDFNSTTQHDWIRRSVDAYEELKTEYDQVYVMGHSMGGILALLLAESFSVEKLVLFAPAVCISAKGVSLLPLISCFRRRMPIKWEQDENVVFFDERDSDDDQFLGKEYWSWMYLKRVRNLLQMRRNCIKNLKKLSASTLVITGGKDPSISESSGAWIGDRIQGVLRSVHLPEAGHLIPYDTHEESRLKAMDEMIHWFDT